jgi:hypothetical protein
LFITIAGTQTTVCLIEQFRCRVDLVATETLVAVFYASVFEPAVITNAHAYFLRHLNAELIVCIVDKAIKHSPCSLDPQVQR